ncbi:cyclic peptide export ABC transporter [uncultured Kordia sp.]|uniref:cyclic peptide export ABC transporter n=1 Tax=uncultured Kordia sp. TaxID=507699 RepID=UPI00260B72E9|nr:cyclic peptide export ABC transporter [uncultured Kordia sp.]
MMFKITFKNILLISIYSLLNTALSFGIIYIINNALSGNEAFLRDYIGMVFIALVVYSYLLNVIFQKQLYKFTYAILYSEEKKLFKKILEIPLIRLEKLGPQRFYTAVEDLRTFSTLPFTVTNTINAVLTLILYLAYMFTLSFTSAFIVIILIIIVICSFLIVMKLMSKKIVKLRSYSDEYYKYVDDVVKGFKELKLNYFRRKNLMSRFLIPNRENAENLGYKVNFAFYLIGLITQYGLYFVIASILFILPQMGLLNRADVIAYVVILLFISSPISSLMDLQHTYTQFLVAHRRLKTFAKDFQIVELKEEKEREVSSDFSSLEFIDTAFSYDNDTNESNFSLGPVNLKLEKGEVIFIVGGNGSGKSTFINILTGLYPNSEGELLLNNEKTENTKEKLQDLTAAVFTNNYIFSQNYENFTTEDNPQYKELLKIMELDTVVLDDNEDSARRNFSKGQSKRMSLIFALLEQKPILVLDEWAADQDPHFRKFFYEELIPKLQKEGKTIIAVTHDDAYFHQADRIIKFDYGKIVKDVRVENKTSLMNEKWL